MGQLTSVSPLQSQEIRELLDGDVVILEYYVARQHVYAFAVTRDSVRGMKLAITRQALEAGVDRFRKEVVEDPPKSPNLEGFLDTGYRANLQELYTALVEPFKDVLREKKHLVVVPHGALHYLPFQALWDGQGYLIQTHSISYAPSASVLKYAKEKHRPTRETFFGVGNPDGTLQMAKVEVEEIAKSFPRHKVLIGGEATEAAVKQQMPNFDILHFATHGELDRRLPLMSHLKLSDGKSTPAARKPADQKPDEQPAPPTVSQARLSVNEIFDLNLQAALVVLSACETGLVRGHRGEEGSPGDELVGLARAFIYAGAPTVVASLWNVADLSTGELMVNFYQRLRGNMIAEALRSAQVQFTRGKVALGRGPQAERGVGGITKDTDSLLPGDHPYFWAAFVVIGDWR
jgi:CHAT domain-containing protein